MKIQINPIRSDGYGVEQCMPHEADSWAVYVGEPGDYYHLCDFKDLDKAKAHANLLSKSSGMEVEDNTGDEAYEDPNDYVGMGWVGRDGRP